MRITGGIYAGRRISCPKGIIRPAMDRMRESVFSILGNLHSLSFLDLFSGSAVMGIEAASRGAEPVVCVEKDHRKKPVLLKNMSIVESDIQYERRSAESYIKKASHQFDLIFMDPPFNYGNKEKLIALAGDHEILAPEGRLVIHHPSENQFEKEIGPFVEYDVRKYGRSIVRFYGFV